MDPIEGYSRKVAKATDQDPLSDPLVGSPEIVDDSLTVYLKANYKVLLLIAVIVKAFDITSSSVLQWISGT